MRFIYDIIFFIFVILYLPVLILKRKWHHGFWMRMGFIPDDFRQQFNQPSKNIWVHAVSVGEVLAVADLVVALKDCYPHYRIIFSTVTKTGHELAQLKLKDKVVVIYAPLDFSFITDQFVRLINPSLYISAETELWPNLFYALEKKNVPIVLVNGRISDKSFRQYSRVKWLVKPVLRFVNRLCVQSQMDKERFIVLGAHPDKIVATGNMKFDVTFNAPDLSEIKLNLDYQYLLAGSTHPGEEEIIVDMYKQLVKQYSSLRLVLVPRHVERVLEVCRLVSQRQMLPIKFSDYISQTLLKENEVVVVDTIGKLRMLYSVSALVFIGKSLCGRGGQNMIEPAFFAKPVLVGPHTQNFRDVMKMFLKEKAIVQVKDAAQLYEQVEWFLSHPQEAQDLGKRAAEVVACSRGSIQKSMAEIKSFLNET